MKASDDRNLGIDVLRGAAALGVLVFHSRLDLWNGLSNMIAAGTASWRNPDFLFGALTVPIFRWGNLGVPLFFVLSGYCIHRPHARRLARDPGYRIPMGEYAFRRAWRIYPVFLATLLLTASLDAVTRDRVPGDRDLGDNSVYCLTMNALSLHNLVVPPYGSDRALWTLAIEIHFYLVYPLVFWGFRSVGPVATTAAVLAANAAYLPAAHYAGWPERFFLSYWFSWTAGAYVAEVELGRAWFPRKFVYLAAGPLLVASLTRDWWVAKVLDPAWKDLEWYRSPVTFSMAAVPFALVVWWAVTAPRAWVWTNAVSRGLAWCGLFSYSLYAIHMPFLYAYRAVVLGGEKSDRFLTVVPPALLAVGLAYLMFLAVEQWSLRVPGGKKPDRPPAEPTANPDAVPTAGA